MNGTRVYSSLIVAVALVAELAPAAYFAGGVVSYTPGVAPVDPVFNPSGAIFLDDPTAALGKPAAAIPGFPESEFDGVVYPLTPAEPLNPFAPHFDRNELTQIAAGGELVLRLERYVQVGTGPELGIFGNVGLTNVDASGDTTQRRAADDVLGFFQSFGIDRVRIEVSETGLPGSWAAVASGDRLTIRNPTSYYTNATGLVGPTDLPADLEPLLDTLTPGDFGQPFAGDITQFNGMTIGQIEASLAGSAGGDWLDLDGLVVDGQPLTRVGYVRFFDPEDTFELMAVSINSSLAGAVVPEPASIVLSLLAMLTLAIRRCRRK
jgi:hypothetical protein